MRTTFIDQETTAAADRRGVADAAVRGRERGAAAVAGVGRSRRGAPPGRQPGP